MEIRVPELIFPYDTIGRKPTTALAQQRDATRLNVRACPQMQEIRAAYQFCCLKDDAMFSCVLPLLR